MVEITIVERDIKREFNRKENNKHSRKIQDWLSRNKNESNPYYSIYKNNFLIPRLIRQYYTKEVFTEEKVRKGMIVEHGRNFADGFSGIRIKNINYSNKFIVEITDGERGQLLFKTYEGLPTKEELIIDSFYISIGE